MDLQFIWIGFIELSNARGSSGMGGVCPITFTEIYCWQQLSGVELEPWEVNTLRRIDELWLKHTNVTRSSGTKS